MNATLQAELELLIHSLITLGIQAGSAAVKNPASQQFAQPIITAVSSLMPLIDQGTGKLISNL